MKQRAIDEQILCQPLPSLWVCTHVSTHSYPLAVSDASTRDLCVEKESKAAVRVLRTHTESFLSSNLLSMKVPISQGWSRPFNIWALGKPAPLHSSSGQNWTQSCKHRHSQGKPAGVYSASKHSNLYFWPNAFNSNMCFSYLFQPV